MWGIFPLSDLAGDTPVRIVASGDFPVYAEVDHLVRDCSWKYYFRWHTVARWVDLRECGGFSPQGVPDAAPATLAGVTTTARVAKNVLGLRYAKVRVVDYPKTIREIYREWPWRFRGGKPRRGEYVDLPRHHKQVGYPPHRPLRPSVGWHCLNYRP